jgi:hypothetical protein
MLIINNIVAISKYDLDRTGASTESWSTNEMLHSGHSDIPVMYSARHFGQYMMASLFEYYTPDCLINSKNFPFETRFVKNSASGKTYFKKYTLLPPDNYLYNSK